MLATLVATSVVSGVGAVPWLERADSDGDGTEELGVEWNSLADEAGAAAASGTPGLSCPAGMVLHEGLCKTPATDYVEQDRVCPQAADGYELVSAIGEHGASHSCQKTVPAYCTGDKVLHQGQCQTENTEQRNANWTCSEGTLVSTFVDPGYTYSCRITVDPPECPDEESYRTTPSSGCYEEVSFYETADYTWTCSEGTLVSTFLDPGYSYSCRVTLGSLTCPDGETYRNNRCETQQEYYPTRDYTWSCSSGTLVTSSGDHGVTRSCRVTLNPPVCPAGETWRNNRCEEQQTYYRTRGYTWSCSEGTRITNSGDHGVSYQCRITLNPPTCPDGETYRSNGCYESESYYNSRPYDYSCPSTYTLGTSGGSRTCTKTETYQERVCSYDPIAGQQCWYETRTRTLTAAVIESCASGYSADGTGCTANSPSTRWVATGSTPTRYRYEPATSSCPSGWSDNGSQCESDTASTRWVATGSTPTRYRYDPATSSCPSGWSDNGSLCESDTASTRWVATGSTPTRYRYDPATSSCPSGWSDNGSQCESDTASTRWDPTGSTPVTSRTGQADRSCDTGFTWNGSSGKCENTTYTDPTAPLTTVVGDPPDVSCPDGYDSAGGGRCSRTTLGPPTATPIGAGCVDDLGTLGAGAVSRSGTLATGCTSLRKGDAQSLHYARRFSLRVSAASTATFTASSSDADAFIYVLSGSGTSVTEVDSDDDSGAGTDAKVTDVALAAETTYTVEVTTSAAGVTGAFTLTGTIAPDEPPVVITDLRDGTGYGLAGATVTAEDEFTVEPADATCTATTATAGVTPSVAAGTAADKRKVSLALAAPFSHEVTVNCDAPGRTATEDTATLSGKVAISSVTVASGTACTGTASAGYSCTVPQGGTLAVTATAQGAHDGLSLAWAGSGGASVGTLTHTAVSPVPGVGFSRTSTAALSCTADGTVTVTVTAGAVTKAVPIGVDCAVASDPCDDPLGSLAEGVTSRSGTIAANASCTSPQRRTSSTNTYYARRHTFTLDAPATVTVDLGSASSNASRLDTYLLLLRGHSSDGTGTVEGRNDDRGGGSRDSRIANKRLAAGDYTIEATTFGSGRTGDYDLSVSVVLDSAVRSVTVSSRDACEPDTDAAPQGVDAVLECEIVNGQTAAVAATAIANHATIGLAWAATGSASVAAAATPAATAILGPDNVATGDWQTTATADLSCTADGTVTLTATAGPSGSADTHTTRLDVDCVDPVEITGLDDATESGTSAVTVSDTFTVSPATAECTAAPVGTATTPQGGAAGDRVLSATFTTPAATTITVVCTNDGYADGVDDVVFTHAGAVTSVTVTATSGGACAASATTPAGVNAALDCDMTDGTTLVLSATADASANGPSLGWTTSGGVSRVRSTQSQRPSPLIAPDGSLGSWRRTGTVTLSCTADGTATLTVSLPAAASHLTAVNADCQDEVQITDLSDTTKTGTGTVTVTDDFSVDPAAASCTATATAGTPTITAGAGGARTASLGVPVGSSADVTVTCTHSGHGDGTASVAFSARAADSCAEHMGTLAVGTTTRSGTIAAVSGCTSPQRFSDGGTSTSRYARRHTFTVASPLRVQIDLASAAANTSRLDTYLLLLEGHSSDGTGTVLGRNDDVGSGHGTHRHNSRLSAVELAPGHYTIEATTYGSRRTGDYTLTVVAVGGAGAACTDDLGTLTAGRHVRTGTVAAVEGCTSTHRGSGTSRPSARWYTFTLDAPAWIDIDLAKATTSSLDPYLLLLSGHTSTGTVLAQDNDSGTATAAQIQGVHLDPGTYTIETTAATHTGTTSTGDYTLTVTVPISGLAQTVDATVDQHTTIHFNYWPSDARIGLQSRSGDIDYLADLLDIGISASGGEVSLSLAVPLVDTHGLSVTRTTVAASNGASGAGGSATRGARQVRSATSVVSVTSGYEFSVDAVCGLGMVVSPSSEQLCVSASLQSNPREDAGAALDEGPLYRVTPGALAATVHAAYTGKSRFETRTRRECVNMSVHRLAAVMLAIPYWENPAFDANGDPTRLLARSPMALSRKDVVRQRGEIQPRNYRLYSANSQTSGPARAFWHPGVGSWQIDDTFAVDGDLAPVLALDHGERADTRIGGTLVAERLLATLCGADAGNTATFLGELAKVYKPWFGCLGESGTQTCRDNTYLKMYDIERDDLLVTSQRYMGEGPVDGYLRDYSPSGGVIDLNCRWGDTGAAFDCWFFNPGNRQGAMQVYDPEADNTDLWKTDPDTGERYRSRTPLAAPFLSFTYVENRVGTKFAVFPAAFLPGSTTTWFKAVPDSAGVRDADYPWQQTSYTFGSGSTAQSRQLQVQVCLAEGTPPRVRHTCSWWPVNSDSLVNVFAAAHLTNRTREDPVYLP
ncbi:hypothetical protein [Candidatus Poriferisodalis sp.]|uniref:hypothetical protein n=1 Tax=Candidatus Poriferisodalis sp. TaxID=3101277 RepID=UPI003B5B88B3